MGLRDFEYKRSYTRGIEDPLNEFLIPILRQCNKFFYISGYFSSNLLALLSYGIKDFITKNDGLILLLVGCFYPKELNILNLTEEQLKNKFIEVIEPEFFSTELDKTPKKIEHLKLLAWLLYNKKMQIRWAIPIDAKTGRMENKGIVHEKIGILQDSNSEKKDFVTFSGSANATYFAWVRNREELKVFTSWGNCNEYAKDDYRKFMRYWKKKDDFLKILEFPVPLKENIIKKYLPEGQKVEDIDFDLIDRNAEELLNELRTEIDAALADKEGWKYDEKQKIRVIETIRPREPYQTDALTFLENHDYKGFLQMATGSGKTKVAIMGSYALYNKLKREKKSLLVIVTVPDSYLVDQWYDNDLYLYTQNVIKCYSVNPKWRDQLKNKLGRLIFKSIDHCYIVGTSKSLNSKTFQELIINVLKNYQESIKLIYIGDEAHTLGAPNNLITFRNIREFFQNHYKIGLSATPIREYDDIGTKLVLEFFSSEGVATVHEFSLKDAQRNDRLMKFNYYTIKCDFDEDKFAEYIELSDQISEKSKYESMDSEISSYLTILLNKRANLLKKCKSKLNPLEDLLVELHSQNKLWNTVIYVKDSESDDNQMEDVDRVIETINSKLELRDYIKKYEIIGKVHDNRERKRRFQDLADKGVNAIIAMKCLDQGVDIPSLEKAVFLSSSGTELEHIQRAGRLLRKSEEKEGPVEIYDFFVFPTKAQIEMDKKHSQKIFTTERKRIEYFMSVAENKDEIDDLLLRLDADFF